MNKKFTMMVAALLAAGGFSANAAIFTLKTAPAEIKKGAQIYLVTDKDGDNTKFTSGELAVGISLDPTSKKLVATTADNNGTDFDSKSNKVTNYLWTVEESVEAGNTYYAFKNSATGNYLAFKDGGFQNVPADAIGSKSNIYFSYDKSTAILTVKNTTDQITVSDNAIKLTTSGSKIYAYSADSKTVTAAELNQKMGGDGFSLAPADGKTVDDANNVFSNQLLAVEFGDNIKNTITNEEIPAGLYFVASGSENLKMNAAGKVVGSAYLENSADVDNPEKMQEAYEALFESFNKCTFVAVSSWDSYQTSEVESDGLKLQIVNGADLIKYNQTVDNNKYATSGKQVYVGNALFTVTEPDQYANPGVYTLSLKEARIKALDKNDQTKQTVNVGVTKIAGTNYVTTLKEPTTFKVSMSSLYAGIKLLNTSKESAAIYTIQFVSGKDVENSEYGKHLGVAVAGGQPIFVAQGNDLSDINLPQYQFVVTDVVNNLVTFTNIETGDEFSTYLYETGVEGQYKLIGATGTVRIAEENAKSIVNYTAAQDMTSMVVALTPVTNADSYAGFFKKEIDNNEAYRLTFARNATTDDKLYVALDQKDNVVLSETDALQVVFEPVVKTTDNKTIDEEYVSTKYAYNSNGKVYYESGKLVKYYTYKMRLVDSETQYVDINTVTGSIMGFKLTDKENAGEVIVKERYDGSVSLIEATKLNSYNNAVSLKQVPTNGGEYVFSSINAYSVPELSNIYMFLESEKLGVSLTASEGHYTFEAEKGGFMNVNDKNEGAIAIRTEAAEDLTFWVDTTNSEKLIPSFYITKGGKFMYNSVDSLYAYNDKLTADKKNNPYAVFVDNDYYPKAIFKASTLVNSDTLKTTVDNKEVVVAEKADQNKGILGGIKYFQFNIVKASDAEDNYVVRNNGRYLANFNGVLGFITSKDNALRFVVEGAAAPTSNEGVSASEVKVIANNGSINVKNAAGKNVVVSTILGQVVANEVLTSDNATINVPAGIVVVAVEGESFKVNVK